jgi:hypothetical protein
MNPRRPAEHEDDGQPGAGDPESVAGDLMQLHEGALVTAGMGVISDPFATGRTAALARLAAA